MARSGSNRREMDKWAKGLVSDMNKSLERAARRNPSRVPVQAEASTAGGALARYEPIESSAYLAQLMLWLDTRTSGGASINHLEQEFPEGPVPLALELEQRGLVKLLRAASGPIAIHLSDEGRVEVHRLKKLQESRAARLRHTIDAFLRWLYDTHAATRPLPPRLCSSPHPGRTSPEPRSPEPNCTKRSPTWQRTTSSSASTPTPPRSPSHPRASAAHWQEETCKTTPISSAPATTSPSTSARTPATSLRTAAISP